LRIRKYWRKDWSDEHPGCTATWAVASETCKIDLRLQYTGSSILNPLCLAPLVYFLFRSRIYSEEGARMFDSSSVRSNVAETVLEEVTLG
jgi:hypothetical protein